MILGIVASLLLGVSHCPEEFVFRHESYWITPMGHKVVDIHNYGGEGIHWHAAGCLDWVDQRVEEWVQQRKDSYAEAMLRDNARRMEYYLYDDWMVGYPPGAHGSVTANIMKVSIYSIGKGPSPPPNAWMPRLSSSGVWWWGEIAGVGCDVIPHELDHTIGIHHG